MNQDLNILQLVLHASFVVQIVMTLLMLVSPSSWSAIFRKLFAIKRSKAYNERRTGQRHVGACGESVSGVM